MYMKHFSMFFFPFLHTLIHRLSSNKYLIDFGMLNALPLSQNKTKFLRPMFLSISISIFIFPSFAWNCVVKCNRAFKDVQLQTQRHRKSWWCWWHWTMGWCATPAWIHCKHPSPQLTYKRTRRNIRCELWF